LIKSGVTGKMKEKVLLLGSESCGTGDNDLGYSIMMQMLEALPERADKPKTIILWNTAVNLAANDSPAFPRLKKIEASGVQIIAGRLCTGELCITDKIAVGKMVGMDEILDYLLNNEVISL
jgi:hypothetical protein